VRFGFIHRVMTDALAALGVLALVLSGQFNRWVSVAIMVGLVGALFVRESWQRHPALRHLDTIALLGVLAVLVGPPLLRRASAGQMLAGAALLVGGFAPSVEARALTASGWAHPLVGGRPAVRAAAPRVTVAGDDAALARDPAAREATAEPRRGPRLTRPEIAPRRRSAGRARACRRRRRAAGAP
jgi:hypothetical protein